MGVATRPNVFLRVTMNHTPRPYIVIKRTRNKGKEPSFNSKTGAQHTPGEFVEEVVFYLSDTNGHLRAWARVDTLQRYVSQKDWKILDYGDFDGYFARMKPNAPKVKEAREIVRWLEQQKGINTQLAEMEAKLADVKAKLAAHGIEEDGEAEHQAVEQGESSERSTNPSSDGSHGYAYGRARAEKRKGT